MNMFQQRREALLLQDVSAINRWLSDFELTEPAVALLQPSGETLRIRNFPLPEQYQPDHVSLAMVVRDYPTDPPKGMYLLRTTNNARVIDALSQRFNVFQGQVFHGAPPIAGFAWVCVGYLSGWRFNARQPHKGDNIQKMLAEFWRLLA